MNPMEKLCFIGKRGMGALEFEPAQIRSGSKSFSLEMVRLVEVVKKKLNQNDSFLTNLKKDDEKAMMEILKIGTSVGGARPKAVIVYNPKAAEVRSGQANVPKGLSIGLLNWTGSAANNSVTAMAGAESSMPTTSRPRTVG